MLKIKAVIVEDEQHAIDNLKSELEDNCPHVEVVGAFKDPKEAVKEIARLRPHVLFLDINLGNLNGFDVLNRLKFISFEVIFVTSYAEHAIRAIKSNALDYILKPFKSNELIDAVNLVSDRIKKKKTTNPQIPIPISDGLRFVPIEEIIYCKADNNRSDIILFNKKILNTSKHLRAIETMLEEFNFFRIHRSFLINKDYLDKYSSQDGGYVIMSNGDRLKASRKPI